jgi:enamine deaminase RidA (YjgF/YER057c/UK114 family)
MTGKVGSELTTEQGYDAARVVALNILATLKGELGDLDRIKQVVKLTAFVNCVDGFSAQPKVVNGASDLLGAVLGDRGKHARSAVGTNALPMNVPVEIEAIIEVE